MTGNDYDGTLINVEGIDGAGKSTAVEAIESRFDDEAVVTTREPTDFWTGDAVYDALSDDDMNPVADFAMFVADRVKHVDERIVPALQNGKIVVTDRYADSTRAYQTHRIADEMNMSYDEAREWMETVFNPWNVEPDITIYIDITVDEAMVRCGNEDKYEKRENLERVRDAYDEMYTQCDHTVRIIDGMRTKSHVERMAINTVTAQLETTSRDKYESGPRLYSDAVDEDK